MTSNVKTVSKGPCPQIVVHGKEVGKGELDKRKVSLGRGKEVGDEVRTSRRTGSSTSGRGRVGPPDVSSRRLTEGIRVSHRGPDEKGWGLTPSPTHHQGVKGYTTPVETTRVPQGKIPSVFIQT